MEVLNRLPEFKRFKALGRVLNTIIDRLNMLIPRGGPGIKIRITSTGTIFETTDSPTRNKKARQFRLKNASNPDFFVCRELTADPRWDPDVDPDAHRFIEGTTDIYIAKPYLLRRTEFDGLTVTIAVESKNGAGTGVTTANRFFSYQYLSANFRIKRELDAVGGNVTASEDQRVHPPFVVDDDVLYADEVKGLQMVDGNGDEITLLARADDRAWCKV